MIYCDSSFLAPLYLPHDPFHEPALTTARHFVSPIPYTFLIELEVLNAWGRMLAQKILTLAEHDRAERLLAQDLADGILVWAAPNQTDHYRKARELSKIHTPRLFCRSLDILQVSAALLLKSKVFCSFDQRQRTLAQTVGLSILPKKMPAVRSKP